MHKTQQLLLKLAETENIGDLGVRELARRVGVTNPQTVKYHLDKLIEAGLLDADIANRKIQKVRLKQGKKGLLTIPVLGSANAGDATMFAEENLQGFLRVSRQLVDSSNDQLFAIRVRGDSMNLAQVNNQTIEDGDLVAIDAKQTDPQSGEYVLSVIDGVANIKKIVRDKENNQVILMSESTKSYPPTYIHEDAHSDYRVNGVVVGVFKQPKNNTL